MIYGNIKDTELIENLYPGFAESFRELRTYTDKTEPGRYPLNGDLLFSNVQKYESKAPRDAKYENHRRYIDIQYIISGREKIWVTPTEGLTEADAYHDEMDYELYHATDDHTTLDMKAGDFVILFPGEAHAPGIRYDGVTPEEVRKVIVKVHVK